MAWRRVQGLGIDDGYMVNELGEVLSIKSWRILKQQVKNGYKNVMVKINGKSSMVGVHRLVCAAFHGAPPSDRHQVDHINRDRLDNRPSNLEWVTPSENIRRAKSKGVQGISDDGIVLFFPHLAMASDYNLNTNAIRKALARDKTRKSQGFVWEYVDSPS